MSNNKQSSVEWIVEQMAKLIPSGNEIAIYSLQEQAKAMHKEEVMKAIWKGLQYYEDGKVQYVGEQYYNETYGGNK